jgi:hypothetical protein
MTDQTTHTIFMLVKTTPAWLALAPGDRFAFLGAVIVPVLAAHPTVSMRFFDAEFYSARVSDVIVWETADLPAYRRLIEALRETAFWGTYFEVGEIIPAVENAYAAHYDVTPVGAAA